MTFEALGFGLLRPFGGLDFFPRLIDAIGCGGVPIAKHMGMTADHFRIDAVGDIFEGEVTFFLCYLRMENHLQQQIPQLIAKFVHVTIGNGVGNFIGFFDGVGGDGRKILFQIPRTPAIRVAQLGHNIKKVVNRFAVMGAHAGFPEKRALDWTRQISPIATHHL